MMMMCQSTQSENVDLYAARKKTISRLGQSKKGRRSELIELCALVFRSVYLYFSVGKN